MSQLRYNVQITTGTLNAVSGTSVTGASVFIGQDMLQLEGDLSAHLILTAATASLTIKPYWQVSNDNTTFVTINNDASAADTAIVTGVANTTKALTAPRGVLDYKFARCMLLVGGATGAAGDLFSIGYSYRQVD
jgi:hypothetical protein